MANDLAHLGVYSDWVDAAKRRAELYPVVPSGEAARQRIREVLGFTEMDPVPVNIQGGITWERDGLAGEEITWSVGYGPKTAAWIMKPAEASQPLPGVIALHGHDGVKFFGKEKIANGKEPASAAVENLRADLYEGRAFANELARQGFVVLAHDVFLWGSRRFPFVTMPESIHRLVENWRKARKKTAPKPTEAEGYEVAAQYHEHLVAKYCALLGTTLAGVVSFEDRVAVHYLRSRPDVRSGPIGCIGLLR